MRRGCRVRGRSGRDDVEKVEAEWKGSGRGGRTCLTQTWFLTTYEFLILITASCIVMRVDRGMLIFYYIVSRTELRCIQP